MSLPTYTPMEEEAVIMAARKNKNVFISYCFLYDDEHPLGRPQHPFHVSWHKAMDEHEYLVVFAPIEHGKTTQLSVYGDIWDIGNNPNIRIWILSGSEKLPVKIVTRMEQIILTNKRVHKVFPHLRPETRAGRTQMWNTTSFIVQRDLEGGEVDGDPTVQATGIMGSSQGSRIDKLMCDDLNTYQNAFYEKQREALNDWFVSADCIGRLTDGGTCTIVGNPWHELALAHMAIKDLGFASISFEACDAKFENILWPREKVGKRHVGFSKERLQLKAKKHGPIEFARCFRCIAVSDQTQWFSLKTMQRNYSDSLLVNDPLPPHFLPLCGVDPAVKKSKGANFASFFVGGYNPITGQKRVKRIIEEKMSAEQILKKLIEIMDQDPDIMFVVEDNGQQSYLIELAQNTAITQAIGATEAQANAIVGKIQPFNTTEDKSDPEVGIAKMSADFEAQLWQIPRCEESSRWFDQFLRWRPGNRRHTGDIVMSSYFFWSEANLRSIGRGYMSDSLADYITRMDQQEPEFSDLMRTQM